MVSWQAEMMVFMVLVIMLNFNVIMHTNWMARVNLLASNHLAGIKQCQNAQVRYFWIFSPTCASCMVASDVSLYICLSASTRIASWIIIWYQKPIAAGHFQFKGYLPIPTLIKISRLHENLCHAYATSKVGIYYEQMFLVTFFDHVMLQWRWRGLVVRVSDSCTRDPDQFLDEPPPELAKPFIRLICEW